MGLLIGMVWSAVIAMAWFIAGMLTGGFPYMVVPALLLLVSATGAALFAPVFFYPTIAFFGGGGMLASGLWARRRGH